MVKKGIKITADPNLVNFHFTSTPQSTSSTANPQHHHHHHGLGNTGSTGASATRPRSGSFNNSNKHNHQHPKKNYSHQHRTAEDRASSRKKISTHMFPLHSSPDHAFVLSRCCGVNAHPSNHQHQQSSSSKISETNNNSNGNNVNSNMNTNYTFQGPDRPVSWESVRIVKCFTPITNALLDLNGNSGLNSNVEMTPVAYIPCPICLDDNCICPRITKCGHTFCYTCILYHIQTYHDKTTNPKCPCCSLPIYMNDLRPIQIMPVQSPTASISSSNHSPNNMRFIKLHRYKYCHSSYIPDPKEPRRLSPNAIPCHTIDNDALYAKFNYVHVPTYQLLLQSNLNDLLSSLEQQQQNHIHRSVSMMEEMVFGLAIQFIQTQLNLPATHSNNMNGGTALLQQQYQQEFQLQQQYSNIGSGFYSLQIPSLIYQHHYSNSEATDTVYQNSVTITTPCSTSGQSQEQSSTKDDHHSEKMFGENGETSTLQSASTSWDNNGDNDQNGDNHHRYLNHHHQQQHPQQRDRGNSVTSVQSCNSMNSYHKLDQPSSFLEAMKEKVTATNGGSMYATDEEYILYQACDGSLCFLSGFNMNCLRTEFASTLPLVDNNNIDLNMEQLSLNQLWDNDDSQVGISTQNSPTTAHQHQNAVNPPTRPPLPDIVEGSIIDIERVLLTPEIRERRRFLSHIPLYTEVCFIEIDINHILSARTKNVYRKEFMKRKQNRLAREKAEQREDELLKRIEQEKIDERKARCQRIDPMDDFFQPVVPMHDGIVEPNMLSEDFGPAISSSTTITSALPNDAFGATTLPGISFSQACQSGELFPTLFSAPTEMNFPALGSSPPNQKTNLIKKKVPPPPPPPRKPWSSASATITVSATTVAHHDAFAATSSSPEAGIVAPPAYSKKSKNKKIVLFSTGAHRNDYF